MTPLRHMRHVLCNITYGTAIMALAFIPHLAAAQLALPAGLSTGTVSPLLLEFLPRQPGPRTEVRATLKSYSIDLDRAGILWQINGDTAREGNGLTSITFLTGESGTSMVVNARVMTQAGTRFETSAEINPVHIDIIFEGAYTPPFYRGGGLPGPGGSVRIAAIANIKDSSGNLIPRDELIYEWQAGSRVFGQQSGRGADSITLPGYQYRRPLDVEVRVATLDGSISATNQITIPTSDPLVLLYENHPTLGVRYEQAVPLSYVLPAGEITLVAEPYFFSATSRNDPNLRYDWRINNTRVENPGTTAGVITLRPTEGAGSAHVSISAAHDQHVAQRANSVFNIDFRELGSVLNAQQ